MEGWVYALLAATCWSAEAVLVRFAGDGVDTLTGTAYGCVASGLVFLAYLVGGGKLSAASVNRSALIYAFTGVLSFAVGHYFYYTAINRSGVGLSVSLVSMYPLLAIILSVILFREPLTLRVGIGALLITLGGVIILT